MDSRDGETPPRRDRSDSNEVIREVIGLARGEIGRNRVELHTQLSDGLPPVLADRVQLQQVMLYYRLNVVAIPLPPIRQCRDDIPAPAHFYVQRYAAETKKPFTGLAPDVQERVLALPWPGNVRERANVIERAVVLGEGLQLTLQDLPPSLGGHTHEAITY